MAWCNDRVARRKGEAKRTGLKSHPLDLFAMIHGRCDPPNSQMRLSTMKTFGLVPMAGCFLIVMPCCLVEAQEANIPIKCCVRERLQDRLKTSNEKPVGAMLYVGDEVVFDYKPRPALVVDADAVVKAKFPVIDVHCHWRLDNDPVKLLQAMDGRNIKRAVNLSGGWGDQLDKMLAKFHKFAPDRFVIFCTPDFSLIDDPDFSRKTVASLERAHSNGAAGVKIYKSLGLTLKDQSGKVIPIDDPRLDVIWAKAGELKMPVLIHSADPVAFFQPIDRFNERWLQLARRPYWSFYGSQFPEREVVLAQRNRVIERHPNTTFIGAHVGNSAEDLKSLSALLVRFPNFNVDISGRVAELGRQPYSARKFIIRFQDRVLFGTDRYPGRSDQPRYPVYFRFLETQNEYFDYYDHSFPPAGEWKIYGIYLTNDVLKKVYYQNAERLLGLQE